MKLTITNIEVNLYSDLADSFCVSGDVVGTLTTASHGTEKASLHCHFYVSRQDRRTLPPASGTGYPIIYINKGHNRPRLASSVWGKAFVEQTLRYADERKLWDAAEAAIAEKAIQEHKANVERRKIARMRDHAEQMYALLSQLKTFFNEAFTYGDGFTAVADRNYAALESLLNKINNDPPQTSNETP